jgi:hypothetical protein
MVGLDCFQNSGGNGGRDVLVWHRIIFYFFWMEIFTGENPLKNS